MRSASDRSMSLEGASYPMALGEGYRYGAALPASRARFTVRASQARRDPRAPRRIGSCHEADFQRPSPLAITVCFPPGSIPHDLSVADFIPRRDARTVFAMTAPLTHRAEHVGRIRSGSAAGRGVRASGSARACSKSEKQIDHGAMLEAFAFDADRYGVIVATHLSDADLAARRFHSMRRACGGRRRRSRAANRYRRYNRAR